MKRKFGVVFFLMAIFRCCTASPGEPERKENLLIPRNLIPLDYNLSFDVNMADEKNLFSATATIKMQCDKPTNQIILNVKELEFEKNDVEVKKHIRNPKCTGRGKLPAKCSTPSEENSILQTISDQYPEEETERYVIIIQNQLKPDEVVTVIIKYKKLTSARDSSFLRYSYINKFKETGWLAVTRSGAINARTLYPCVDERDLKTPVTITIASPKYMTLSNTDIKGRAEFKFGTDQVGVFDDKTYSPTIPLSTFSIGLFIGDFVSDNKKASVRIWADLIAIDHSSYAEVTAGRIFGFYQFFFDMGNARKIDIVALPNYGRTDKYMYDLIATEQSLIINTDPENNNKKIEIAFHLCDVLSHQYFLPQTNTSKWSENWLNVGLALIFRIPCFEEIFPDEKKNLVNIDLIESFIRMSDTEPGRVFYPLMLSDNQIDLTTLFENTALADIAYALVRMLSFVVNESEDVLQKGAQKLIAESRAKIFDLKEVWNFFQGNKYGKYLMPKSTTLQTLIDSWTSTDEIPVIKLTRVSGKNMVTLSQEPSGYNDEGKGIFKYVPISYSTKKDLMKESKTGNRYPRRTLVWLKNMPYETSLKDDEWIIHDSEINVLCRYLYEKSILDLLEISLNKELEYKIIPDLARAQLISDMFAFAETNKYSDYSYSVVLRILKYLRHETSLPPLMVALHEFNKIRSRLISSDAIILFQEYVQNILQSILDKKRHLYKSVGELEKYDYDEYYLKKLIVTSGGLFRVESIIHQSTELFSKWQNDKSKKINPIPQAIRQPIYCTAIEDGGEQEWKLVWNLYDKNNPRTSDDILNALACTKDPAQLKEYLEWSINADKIALENSLTVFKSVGRNREGYPLMVEFLQDNFRQILKVHENNRSNVYLYLQILYEITRNEDDFKKLEDLFIKDQLENVETHIKESKLKAERNILWFKNHEEDIISFLKSWKSEEREEEEEKDEEEEKAEEEEEEEEEETNVE